MKEKIQMIQELIDKAEQFAKTNVELYRLKAIDKATDIFSSIASAIVIAMICTFFIIIFSIGLALWIGDILGKIYYGFFIVAGIYLIGIIVLVVARQSLLEVFFNNYIVRLIFREKRHAGNL